MDRGTKILNLNPIPSSLNYDTHRAHTPFSAFLPFLSGVTLSKNKQFFFQKVIKPYWLATQFQWEYDSFQEVVRYTSTSIQLGSAFFQEVGDVLLNYTKLHMEVKQELPFSRQII